MSAPIKPGSRWQSVACDTQVVVVRPPTVEVDLRCGGASMVPVDDSVDRVALDAAFAEGTLLGKRYTDDETAIEVLCTTPGAGSLSIGDRRLTMKQAKPLPSSD